MRLRRTTDADAAIDSADQPIVAGRLDWVTTMNRDQLADLATRSRTLAGTARTRVTPLSELPARRFRSSQPVSPPQDEKTSSTPWMLIAVVASLVSVLVFIAARRSQQRDDYEADIDVFMASDTLPPESPSMHAGHGFDSEVATNP